MQVDQFRRQIILMKKYLSVCRVASAEKLLLRLVSRQHFVDGAELYSVEDLVSNLKMALFYSKHVFLSLKKQEIEQTYINGAFCRWRNACCIFYYSEIFLSNLFSSGMCAAI